MLQKQQTVSVTNCNATAPSQMAVAAVMLWYRPIFRSRTPLARRSQLCPRLRTERQLLPMCDISLLQPRVVFLRQRTLRSVPSWNLHGSVHPCLKAVQLAVREATTRTRAAHLQMLAFSVAQALTVRLQPCRPNSSARQVISAPRVV